MAEELLSIEMRLTVDRALRDYNEFKDKLKARPIDVKFDLGLNKVLADAQAHFNKHKISVDLDWSEARSSFVKVTKEFGTIKTKIHVDDSELVKLKRDINEVDRALIDIGVKVDRSGFDAFEKQVKGLADRSIKLSTLTDTKGFDAFQKSLAALSDRTISISGGSGIGALQKDVQSLVADLKGLSDRVVNLSVNRSGSSELTALVAELGALHDKTISLKVDTTGEDSLARVTKDIKDMQGKTIDLKVDVKGDEISALNETIAELKSKSTLSLAVDVKGDSIKSLTDSLEAIRSSSALSLAVDIKGDGIKSLTESMASLRSQSALSLKVDVVGDDIQNLLSTIDDIRAKALKLDVQVAGGEFKDLVGALDQMRSEVVKVQFSSDISGLVSAHDRIEDFKEAAHNGIKIPITTDQAQFDESVAQLRAIEKLAIQVEVDKGKLAAAVALIQSNLNPEDFVAKLTIDTSDLEGSAKRLREAQKEFTAYRREVEDSFSTKTVQSAITDQLRNVKVLQAAEEARIKRVALLERLEGLKTINELRALAKELQITPTIGTKKSDYEAMLREFLAIEDAAERVSKAWKITGQKFDDIQDEMKAKAEHVGQAIFEAENHGAADLVKFAWQRTGKEFSEIQNRMQAQAEKAGKAIAAALDAAAKDSTFKLTVDSKTAKKDLADFQNYAKLLVSNDLAFNINKAKSDFDPAEVTKQIRGLQAARRTAAQEDRAAINEDIAHLRTKLSLYSDAVKGAKAEASARKTALADQAMAFKVLIANTEAEEKAQNEVTAAVKRTREEADRLADERAAAAKQRQADDDKAIAAQNDYLRGQQKIADEAAQHRATEARERADFDKRRMAAQDEYLARLRKDEAEKQKIIDAANKEFLKLAADRQKRVIQDKRELAGIQKALNAAEDADSRAYDKARLAEQKRFIQDTMALKDTKVDPSGAGGLGVAGIGADLSKLDKLKEKLEAVQRTKRELIKGGIDLKINDNLDQFRAALNKLAKEEITITAKIKEEYEGGKPGGKLGGALKGIGSDFLQAFNIDLQSVVQGLVQGYQAIAGGLVGVAKASLAEYAAVEGSAKQTALLVEQSTGKAIKQAEAQSRLFDVIEKASLSSGNLFAGKEIGALTLDLKRAGGDLAFIEQNLSNIATGATAAKQDLSKFGIASLQYAEKFATLGGDATLKLQEQKEAVKLLTFALTNAKIDATEFGKSIQYYSPLEKGRKAMQDFAVQTVAFARVGVKGSKTGTDLNSVFKELGSTLDGTSKKSDKQRLLFNEIAEASKDAGISLESFTVQEGQNKGDVIASGDALQKLVDLYKNYEKTVGNSQANARFQELFGVKGLAAVQNAVAVYDKAFKEISLAAANLPPNFADNFAASMAAGFSGGVQKFGNVIDTYKLKIGRALEPIATAGLAVFNNAATKSLELGSSFTGKLSSIQVAFERLGTNEKLMNNLAQAFNRVGNAVGDKLLGLLERAATYLSNDDNVMRLANGISFWITTVIDAFTTATELFINIGIAGAELGDKLSGIKLNPFDAGGSKQLADANAETARITKTLEGQRSEYMRITTELGTAQKLRDLAVKGDTYALSQQKEYSAVLASHPAKLIELNAEIDKSVLKLKEQDAAARKFNETMGQKSPTAGLGDFRTFEGAIALWGKALSTWKELKIGEDLKQIWDKLLAPAVAGQLSFLSIVFQSLGYAIKVPLTLLAGMATAIDAVGQLGVAAAKTGQDFAQWVNLGGIIEGVRSGIANLAAGAATNFANIGSNFGVVTTGMGNAWTATQSMIGQATSQTGSIMATTWAGASARWGEFTSSMWTTFLLTAQNLQQQLGVWLSGFAQGVVSAGQAWNNFTAGMGAAFDRAQQYVLAQLNTIAQGIGNLAARIPGVFQAAWNAASASASRIGDALYSSFARALNGVQSAIGQVVNYFQSAWEGAIDAIGGRIGGLIDRARQIPVVGGLIPGFASGGVIMGPASKTDNVMIMARGGEGVLVPEAVNALGGAAGLERLNRRAEAGALGFAAGGVISPLAQLTVPGGQTTAEYIKSKQVTVKAVTVNPPAVNSAIVTTGKTAEKSAVLAKTVALDQATYWARSLALLNNLYAGMKSISDKISQLKVTFAQPIASYSSGSGLLGAPSLSAAPASNPLTVFNNGVLAAGGTANGKTEIKVARTGKTDSEGLEILRMDLVEVGTGRIVDSVLGNSGVRSTQFYKDTTARNSLPGGLAPIPTGKFGIGKTTSSYNEGIGGWFVPIEGAGDNVMGRGDFGIHMDANRAMSPGSAGCIVLYDTAAKSRVQAWLNNANAPKELTVSYGNATPIDGRMIAAATNSSVSRGTGGKGAYKKLFKIGSDADLYQMAITAITEGLAGSPTSQLDSAVSIANRVNAGGFGKDAKSVVSAPGAYEAYTRFGLSGVTDRASAEAKLRSLGYKDSTLENFLKALDDNAMLLKSVEHLKGSTDYRAYVPGVTLQARAGDPQRTKNDNYYIPGGDSYASIDAAKARQLHVQAQAVINAAGAAVAASASPSTQNNLTQAQVNFKALTEKLAPADQALVASVDAGDTAKAAADLKKRLDELSAERDALIKSAPTPADPKKATEAEVKANKALKEKVAALDKRKTELQSVINATYKIDTAETQISNRKAEAAYNDEMAALNEYARLIGGAKEDAKESAKLRDLMRARDESQAEVAIAQKNKVRDLEILDVENANAIKREQSRKGGDVEALRKLQALQKTDKIAALDEAIREAQYAVATQNNKLEDFYRVNGLDDRADALAEVIALQKRVREKSIDQQELDAALKRLGIANINGQFVVDKALTAQLSDISGKVEKAAERSQGQIEKLMRGQGLVLKDALFEALDLEYNYYMQKRDSDLNKASAEQLSFLYGKNLLRTGSFEGGSYIQGAQGNLRDRVGEISLTSEAAIRNKKLDAISALARINGGLTEEQAKAMAEAAGGKIEVVRAGVNPGVKQATGKRLTALSDVPYTPRSEIQAAIRESQSTVAAPLVAASAPAAGYMAKATAPMRIKLDIPPGTDERITSVVRQTEAALNSDEYTQRMLGEFMSILRSDPQLARQVFY
jgi:hypothetical protein